MITRLNTIVAGISRDRYRTVASSQRGDSSQRASQVGVPISISGAAIIEYVTCCTMCTENR